MRFEDREALRGYRRFILQCKKHPKCTASRPTSVQHSRHLEQYEAYLADEVLLSNRPISIVRLHVRLQLPVVSPRGEMSAPLVSKPRLEDDECGGSANKN